MIDPGDYYGYPWLGITHNELCRMFDEYLAGLDRDLVPEQSDEG